MKLIVGLGNPGYQYSSNRHNLGFMCISYIARKQGIKFDRKLSKARIGAGTISGNDVVLAKPQTYMNSSGESVALLLNRFKMHASDLIVIVDDLDLPFGKIRIRDSGSSGGHRGIQSIIQYIGTPDFIRIRIGIGRPDCDISDQSNVIEYVLDDFSRQETGELEHIKQKINDAILTMISEGIEASMRKFN